MSERFVVHLRPENPENQRCQQPDRTTDSSSNRSSNSNVNNPPETAATTESAIEKAQKVQEVPAYTHIIDTKDNPYLKAAHAASKKPMERDRTVITQCCRQGTCLPNSRIALPVNSRLSSWFPTWVGKWKSCSCDSQPLRMARFAY